MIWARNVTRFMPRASKDWRNPSRRAVICACSEEQTTCGGVKSSWHSVGSGKRARLRTEHQMGMVLLKASGIPVYISRKPASYISSHALFPLRVESTMIHLYLSAFISFLKYFQPHTHHAFQLVQGDVYSAAGC